MALKRDIESLITAILALVVIVVLYSILFQDLPTSSFISQSTFIVLFVLIVIAAFGSIIQILSHFGRSR